MITENTIINDNLDENVNNKCNENEQNLHPCHCKCHDKDIETIYDNIEDAIDAANNKHLLPGATYITYYKENDNETNCPTCNPLKTRCIIAVGNVTSNQKHVIFDNYVSYEDIKIIKSRITNAEEEIINIKAFDTSINDRLETIENSFVEMKYTLIDPSTGEDIHKTMNILVKNN